MRKFTTSICFLSALSVFSACSAQTQYLPEPNEQIGPTMDHSYFGVGIGANYAPTTNSDLINGAQATSFNNSAFTFNAYLGHYFNPYFALEINLTHTPNFASQYANNVSSDNTKNQFKYTIFGLVTRPTLPINDKISLYTIAGYGMIVRSGFNANNQQAMSDTNISTFLTGGGFTYQFLPYWNLDLGAEYAVGRPSDNQPGVTYVFAGLHYLIHKRTLPDYYDTQYIFHKNYLQFGAFSKNVWNTDFVGATHVNSGFAFAYERDFFHTHKVFEMDVGTNVASYHAANNQVFQTFSVFPDFRFWFLRTEYADLYAKFNIAGPTYITNQYIDGLNLGGEFIFYDGIGFGGLFGKNKNVMIAAMITHYSNGGLFPENPGVQIPLMFSAGVAF